MSLVIFDCDGVLVDSEPLTNTLIANSLSAHGLPIAPAQCQDLFTGGTMHSAMQEARRRGATLPDDWVAQINAEAATALAKGVPLIDGIVPLIDRIEAAGIKTAIASNGPQAKMQASLGPSGLWARFQGRIHSAHDAGSRPKPDPAMLVHAAQQAGVPPTQCAMIDDNPSGLIAARAAQMMAIGLAVETDPDRLRPHADHVVTHPDDIDGLLAPLMP